MLIFLPARGNFCSLLITFANSLDPDQDCQKDQDCQFNTLNVFLKEFFKKVNFVKISRRQKSMQNYPACKELTTMCLNLQLHTTDQSRSNTGPDTSQEVKPGRVQWHSKTGDENKETVLFNMNSN